MSVSDTIGEVNLRYPDFVDLAHHRAVRPRWEYLEAKRSRERTPIVVLQ